MQRFGLIGYPLSHSFSKKFFTEKFLREHIEAQYELYPLTNIQELTDLLKSNPGLRGINVTIPYKKQVIPFLQNVTDAVQEMSACNCIKIDNGIMTGYNTDVTGFELSLIKQLKPYHTKALVLGTGGAAAAVEFVLRKLQIEYLLVSRSKESKANVISYDEVDNNIVNENLLIINTTPVGMYPNVDESPNLPYHLITPKHYLYDLVYNPAETLFLQKGKQQGADIKNGEEMLIIQAEESWRIWNE
jgi:shikimate dehydrogenase